MYEVYRKSNGSVLATYERYGDAEASVLVLSSSAFAMRQVEDKRHLYKTAKMKSTSAFVGIKEYDASQNIYLCALPFGGWRWVDAGDLEKFCL